MSALIDRIRAAQSEAGPGTISVDVEAWDVTVYAAPVQVRELAKWMRKYPDYPRITSPEMMVDVVIDKACDKDGNRLFTLENKMDLMAEPPGRIATIWAEIFNPTTVEDHEKN